MQLCPAQRVDVVVKTGETLTGVYIEGVNVPADHYKPTYWTPIAMTEPKRRKETGGIPERLNAKQGDGTKQRSCIRTNDYAPTGFWMKLLKSNSLCVFQSGIIGSFGLIATLSTIMLWS